MRIVVLCVALLAFSVPALAQAPSPNAVPVPAASSPNQPDVARATLVDLAKSRVDTMLRSGRADGAVFSAAFLAQVSVVQVDTILAQIGTALGTYERIEGTSGQYTAHFAKGTDDVFASLDADGKIAGLLFNPLKFKVVSLAAALEPLRVFAGTLSYVLVENGTERAALDPAAPLAVGSAFKLAVLAALQEEILGGRRQWSDVVPLEARLRTLPSGILHTWPDGTPITLATYAAEMISISDNMAADTLVRLLGQDALAPYAMGNVPFLTTREMFILKSSGGATERASYLAARTPADRSVVLRAVEALPLPVIGNLATEPILAVEWHYDVRTLCALMGRVARLPLMSINPGAADPAAFRSVAFKGGSDAGIINLTTQVTTKRGTVFCFSATLNDATHAVDENAFTLANASVLSALEDR